jgi:anaerobic selenocysteine-containing dehydrogenase
VEVFSQALAAEGVDPLPGRFRDDEDDGSFAEPALALRLVSGASHHFVSSSLASQHGLLKGAGEPFVEVHPDDAAARGIADGDGVVVANGRGEFRVRARVTDAVRRGVVVSPKGHWGKLSGGHNVNRITSDALGDMAGQSTFHSTRVWLRRMSDC